MHCRRSLLLFIKINIWMHSSAKRNYICIIQYWTYNNNYIYTEKGTNTFSGTILYITWSKHKLALLKSTKCFFRNQLKINISSESPTAAQHITPTETHLLLYDWVLDQHLNKESPISTNRLPDESSTTITKCIMRERWIIGICCKHWTINIFLYLNNEWN